MTAGGPRGEFDEEGPRGTSPLLPPDDRLWRHPSEMAADLGAAGIDPAEIRKRWLEREPTRATAWTAGLVGALLATGIVLVGTHLAAFLTRPPLAEQTDSNTPIPVSAPGTTIPSATAHGYGLGATLSASVSRIGDSIVSVYAFRGSTEVESLGIVMDRGGSVLIASHALADPTSILVEPPHGGVDLVASVSATDLRSGLALLHVNGMAALPAPLDDGATADDSTFALAVTSAGGTTYAPASLTSTNSAPVVGGVQLIDAVGTDLSSNYAPLGSPVIDSSGRLVGMVVGSTGGRDVLAPAWILTPVADELGEIGKVSQGWMGINGVTVTDGGGRSTGVGVRVEAVTHGSAADRAGLVVGDVITAVDDLPVASIATLQGHLYVDRPGTVVTVTYLHHHLRRQARVTLANSRE